MMFKAVFPSLVFAALLTGCPNFRPTQDASLCSGVCPAIAVMPRPGCSVGPDECGCLIREVCPDGGPLCDARIACDAPIGCTYVGGTACACGQLRCTDGGSDARVDAASDARPSDAASDVSCETPIDCAPPPAGCHYEGMTLCSCGQLICLDASADAANDGGTEQ